MRKKLNRKLAKKKGKIYRCVNIIERNLLDSIATCFKVVVNAVSVAHGHNPESFKSQHEDGASGQKPFWYYNL